MMPVTRMPAPPAAEGRPPHRVPTPDRSKLVDDQIARVLGPRSDVAGGLGVLDGTRQQFGAGPLTLPEWLPLLGANPEILFRFINAKGRGAQTQRLTNGPRLEVRRPASGAECQGARYEGAFHIESLNPFNNDTLLLVAAFGRLLRNAAVMGAQGPRERAVLITGVSWARRNKSVRSGALSAEAAEEGLGRNLASRTALYRLAGLEPLICNVADAPLRDSERTVSEATLRDDVRRLKALVLTFWPHLYDKTLGPREKTLFVHAPFGEWTEDCPGELQDGEGPQPVRLSGPGGENLLALFPELRRALPRALAPQLLVLRNIAVHQGRLSEDYFYYFLAQLYFQGAEFQRFLKVAPISERRFDDPMFAIHPEACRMDALYLPHYRLAKTRMLSYSTEHIDLSGLPPAEVAEHIFTLAECGDAASRPKLLGLLARTSRLETMRILADVVSFYALVFRARGHLLAPVEEALRRLDGCLFEALEAASGPSLKPLRRAVLEWTGGVFLPRRDDRAMPFYLAPFFWPEPSGEAASEERGHIATVLAVIGAEVASLTGA